jgi:hypothetical protein
MEWKIENAREQGMIFRFRERLRNHINLVWFWFWLGLIVLLVGLLVGPRVPDDQQAANCVVNVHLPGPFGIALNCDSPEYLRLAHDPAGLLERENTRQSRPGMVLAAAAVSIPFLPFADLPKLFGVGAHRSDIDPQRIGNALATNFPAYAAYMTINVAILCFSFFFFLQTCRGAGISPSTNPTIAASIGILLIANDVTKAYFWSPHSQMFNVFIPIFAVWAFLRALNGGLSNQRFSVVAGLITGLGMTAYPTFVVVIGCVVLAALLSIAWNVSGRKTTAANLALFIALTIAPGLLWYLFVRVVVGEFYSHEFANGPDIWIPAALAQSYLTPVLAVLHELRLLIAMALPQAIALGGLTLLLVAVVVTQPRLASPALRHCLPVALSALVASTAIAVFYALAGTMYFRWAYASLPPLLLALGVLALAIAARLPPPRRRALEVICVALACAQLIYAVVKDGPFS